MPRGGIEKPIGYEVIWKDRPGRTRIKVKVAPKKFVDKRVVEYLKYHPNEDLKDCVIVHLDSNPFNFDKDNLVKIPREVHMFMIHHKLYFNDAELTKSGIILANFKVLLKKTQKKIKGGKNV